MKAKANCGVEFPLPQELILSPVSFKQLILIFAYTAGVNSAVGEGTAEDGSTNI